MGSLKTFLLICLLAAGPVSALPQAPREQAKIFAVCAGRLSALMRHQWLVDGPASEHTEALREVFLDLLEAVAPDAQELPAGQPMGWRVEARTAQAALLNRAAFPTDARTARWANRTAESRLAECRALVPGL